MAIEEQRESTASQPTGRLIAITAMGTIVVIAVGASIVGLFRPISTPPTPVPPVIATAGNTKPEVNLHIKGNNRSFIYHLPGCLNYDSISSDHIEWFKTEEEAEDAGYRRALNC